MVNTVPFSNAKFWKRQWADWTLTGFEWMWWTHRWWDRGTVSSRRRLRRRRSAGAARFRSSGRSRPRNCPWCTAGGSAPSSSGRCLCVQQIEKKTRWNWIQLCTTSMAHLLGRWRCRSGRVPRRSRGWASRWCTTRCPTTLGLWNESIALKGHLISNEFFPWLLLESKNTFRDYLLTNQTSQSVDFHSLTNKEQMSWWWNDARVALAEEMQHIKSIFHNPMQSFRKEYLLFVDRMNALSSPNLRPREHKNECNSKQLDE